MLVRAGDGEWLQLRPVGSLPPGGFRAICGADAATLLELDAPLPVVAFGDADDDHMVDAICLTPQGGIALLVATFDEDPARTLWRLTSAAGALRGMPLDVFAANCGEVHDAAPAHWLAERVGGDAGWLEERIRETLDRGSFEFVLVTGSGAGELAAPMRYLHGGPGHVRVYEVEIMRAGDVQAVEGVEVNLDGTRAEEARPRRFELLQGEGQDEQRQTAEAAPEHAPELVAVEPQHEMSEPQAEAQVEAQVETAAEDRHEPEQWVEPEAAAEAELEEEESAPQVEAPAEEAPPLGEPSDEAAFLAAVDRMDHRSSAHVRFLHGRLLGFVGQSVYTRDGEMQYFVGWTREEQPRPLVGLDSHGSFTVVLRSLPEHEQAEYANELAGLIPDATGEALLEFGVAELSVIDHLADETLLEYVVDNLAEALPGGREAWAAVAQQPADDSQADEPRAEDDAVDEDFFAGVSGDHDPQDVAAAVEQHAPAELEANGEPARPEHDAAPATGAPSRGGGFARRLRRRDAA